MNEEKTKSFAVSKRMVYNSYLKVKKRKGSAGVDKVSLTTFEIDLGPNLYKIWNRMASGSYFPPALRTVPIPKKSGGTRHLGIPTVGDRIAQGVMKEYLEPEVEKIFHPSSFGYRPEKSAHQGVLQCQKNCQTHAWVVDVDIKGFFDNISHRMMMELLNQHTEERWVLLYVSRWLKAGVLQEDGSIKARDSGTPQGGVISPLLANIYLHHAFDRWMQETYESTPFERYADDIVIHCHSYEEATDVLKLLRERLRMFELELNEKKTRIIYCKNDKRQDTFRDVSFNFLGFTFKPRTIKDKFNRNKLLLMYMGTISKEAITTIRRSIKWCFKPYNLKSTLVSISGYLNPKIRGWLNYYGLFTKLDVTWVINVLMNRLLLRRLKRMYKLTSLYAALKHLSSLRQDKPRLFAHWT